MNRIRFIILVIYAILITLTLLRVYVQTQIGVLTIDLAILESEENRLQNDNNSMKNDVLRETSLYDLGRQASLSGFIYQEPIFLHEN